MTVVNGMPESLGLMDEPQWVIQELPGGGGLGPF